MEQDGANIIQYLHISMLVPKSPQSCFATVSKKVLAKESSAGEVEEGLRQIFRMSLGSDGGQSTNFLLCRVPWFEQPYSRLKNLLLKMIAWQAGKGKSQAAVCYNMVAEGMLSNGWQNAASIVATLADTQRDCSVLFSCLRDNYPYKTRTVEIHLNYLKGLLKIARTHLPSREQILSIVFEKLSSLDNEIPMIDTQATSAYPDEEELMDSRDSMDPLATKLDCLLCVLLDYIDGEEALDDLLKIFKEQILITDRLTRVQFVIFYACQKNRQLSFKFMTEMLNKMTNPQSCKFAYINNLFYLSSYIVHSSEVTSKIATAILKQAIIPHLKRALEHADSLPEDITKINLIELHEQNEPLLQTIQILPYVCTFRPQLYEKLREQIDQVLTLANKKCLFETFVNKHIWERFVQSCRGKIFLEPKTHTERMNYVAKFNAVTLQSFGLRIDPLYRFSDLPLFDGKRKNQYVLEDKPTKKLKMGELDSQISDESTVLYRGSTPHREVF